MSSRVFTLLLALLLVIFCDHDVDSVRINHKQKANYLNATESLNTLLVAYDKRFRPYHREDRLLITVQAEVVSFQELDEIEMQFGMDMFFRQSWKDPRLLHHDNPSIILSGKERTRIWLPDTFFYNIKEAHHHSVPSDNSRVEILPDGTVIYSSRITINAACEMDFRNYPMDTQTCSWEILSYSFKNTEIDYRWEKVPLNILNDQLAQFTLQHWDTARVQHNYVSGSYTHLKASFTFARQLAYSFIQVYIPTAMVVSLSYLSFWVQKSAVPARIALGITTVLTLVTLMGSLRSAVPKVSYIKAIDWYLIVGFIFIFGALLEYVLVLSRAECSRDNTENHDDIVTNNNPESAAQANGIEAKPALETKRRRRQESALRVVFRDFFRRKIATSFGSKETDLYDKICRVVYPIVFVLFNVVYWTVYAI